MGSRKRAFVRLILAAIVLDGLIGGYDLKQRGIAVGTRGYAGRNEDGVDAIAHTLPERVEPLEGFRGELVHGRGARRRRQRITRIGAARNHIPGPACGIQKVQDVRPAPRWVDRHR